MTEETQAPPLFAFEVWIKGHEHHPRVVHHRTLGKAKYAYLRDISDAFPDGLPFELVRGRKLGAPVHTDKLRRVAEYRRRPELVAGARVRVGDALGYIVDGNSSANFNVLFDDDSRYQGGTLNVHPSEITLAGAAT